MGLSLGLRCVVFKKDLLALFLFYLERFAFSEEPKFRQPRGLFGSTIYIFTGGFLVPNFSKEILKKK